MELFGFNFDRLRVTAPDAITDLIGAGGSVGGFLGDTFSEVADNDFVRSIANGVGYLLPSVKIFPDQSAGRPTQTYTPPLYRPPATAPAGLVDLNVGGSTAILVAALIGLGVYVAVRR